MGEGTVPLSLYVCGYSYLLFMYDILVSFEKPIKSIKNDHYSQGFRVRVDNIQTKEMTYFVGLIIIVYEEMAMK